ncbi:MAG: MarR family transcriptional regulator [Hyphomicrobiaceae bacterium]|nr:MarR family transcriptional regulator [Hyphomicrobiaceae bacterium]
MADINPGTDSRRRDADEQEGDKPVAASAGADAPACLAVPFVELLFFAYRDFTAEPDSVLCDYDFGRAHHRVLHFVFRNPGLRVADLLVILKITKQSLARVLRQLIDDGFITQEPGRTDRRERHLYVTERGGALAEQLLALQCDRIGKALAEAGPEAAGHIRSFLMSIIAEEDREGVAKLIDRTSIAGSPRT